MKLFLKGHDLRYAVESMLLTLFPNERPEYPETDDGAGSSAVISCSVGPVWATAHAKVRVDCRTETGSARVKTADMKDELTQKSLLQKIVKLAFYRAAVKLTGAEPVWGALTGVRPAKLAAGRIRAGMTDIEAQRELQQVYRVSPERSRLCVQAARAGLDVRETLQERDAALYVGIPFCPTRCSYCSFVSIGVEQSGGLIEPFTKALCREIGYAADAAKKAGLRIKAVYFGGGTPTTLSAQQMHTVMTELSRAFDLSAVEEYTVEAGRPDTITEEKLQVLRQFGVDRISINPQTMQEHVLEAIGRRHSPEAVVQALELAKKAGFTSVNMDLIAGLPEDTAAGFAASLDAVLALEPENVTVHTLSLKKGSRLTGEGTTLPGKEEVEQMLDYACRRLTEAGYAPYYLYRAKYISGGFENIGWTKPGHTSIYNIMIMEELCTVLALGGGGSTKLVDMNTGYVERVVNPKFPKEYIDAEERIIKAKERIPEFYRERVGGV